MRAESGPRRARRGQVLVSPRLGEPRLLLYLPYQAVESFSQQESISSRSESGLEVASRKTTFQM